MVKITRLKDRLYMAPLKKYEIYGKFPWKLIIQILLITFTTCQTILVVNQSQTYSYSQYTLWNMLFLNEDVQSSDTTITNTYNIFSANSLKTYISKTVNTYFDVNSNTISTDKVCSWTDSEPKNKLKLITQTLRYNITNSQ